MFEAETFCFHPCLVLAHDDPVYAAGAIRAFRRLGWDAYTARTGPEARRLSRMLGAGLVVLAADLPGETGWLTCAKLVHELPMVKVVLVADTPDARQEQLAEFVGASSLVDGGGGVPALLAEVEGAILPAAG
jgi:DNA-binding response OmpR family regulator